MSDLAVSLILLSLAGIICVVCFIVNKLKRRVFKREKVIAIKFGEGNWILGNWNKEL